MIHGTQYFPIRQIIRGAAFAVTAILDGRAITFQVALEMQLMGKRFVNLTTQSSVTLLLPDRIVVKPQEAEAKTAGGIVLPDSAKEKPLMGTVVSVGPGKMLDSGNRGAMSVKKKDVVLYSKYGGTDVEVDGTEYKIFRESEILGIVE